MGNVNLSRTTARIPNCPKQSGGTKESNDEKRTSEATGTQNRTDVIYPCVASGSETPHPSEQRLNMFGISLGIGIGFGFLGSLLVRVGSTLLRGVRTLFVAEANRSALTVANKTAAIVNNNVVRRVISWARVQPRPGAAGPTSIWTRIKTFATSAWNGTLDAVEKAACQAVDALASRLVVQYVFPFIAGGTIWGTLAAVALVSVNQLLT